MKYWKLKILLVLNIAFTTLSTANGAEQFTVVRFGNAQMKMKTRDVQTLGKVQKQGVTVVYPSFVPKRYVLTEVKVTAYEPKHPDYALTFKGPNKHSFVVETAFDGIGDGPDGYKRLSGTAAPFGKFGISVFKPHTEGNDTKEFYYISDWMELKKKPSKDAMRFYHFYGTGITDAESIAIMKSLAPMEQKGK